MPTGPNWITIQLPGGETTFPIPQPDPDVQGYALQEETITREDADKLSQNLQSLYDTLPDREQRAFEALVRNLAGP